MTAIKDLHIFIGILKKENELLLVETPVDPCLEIAEIHRRVIEKRGPALLFTNVKGSKFPVVTNLFGTERRMDLAFGKRPVKFINDVVKLAETILPPDIKKLWEGRNIFQQGLKIGLKKIKNAPVLENRQSPPRLSELPMLTSWHSDGGPFVTLPLVYTEHPDGKGHNLGMYRIQRHDDCTTGIHWQIHKGGGYHYNAAEKKGEPLPVNLYIGGPPALILSAIAPVPEDVPELILASLLLGKRLEMVDDPLGGHAMVASAEFAIKGEVPPFVRKPEGPFGDHFGYNSLRHDYPVFNVDRLYHRSNAIYPATVVGRPRQEDYYIGDYLQELLSPLFPLVMKGVRQLKTFGDTGFHSLAAARVYNRYPREAFASAMRILGEGQLSLTKFLIITDGDIDVSDFPELWTYVLERVNWQTDLFVFDNVSQDTLDYTGPAVNRGSKAVLMGLGNEPLRKLPGEFRGRLPDGCDKPVAFLPGTLVIEGKTYKSDPGLGRKIARDRNLAEWPVVVLVDNSRSATLDLKEFLWTFFTRFEPAGDIYGNKTDTHRFHTGLSEPVVFDCRMKPWYPPVLEVDEKTRKMVDEKIGSILPAQWR
ncbi:MAG TPA: UbiD family decarboxylase [Nitrospirae bacterium]|nr:4-hydroxybenzoate decarboxylase subunit C [bacterium BMS3Abin06]HDH12944.1 UbiD family decarboxylase [Nitrospirota bacterium]HDZ00432.1 UbiD family decarboxylase [Nitrospirota bacterium]